MTQLPQSHANFRDPWGLLVRMVRSGDRAAYEVLVRTAATGLLAPLDRLLQVAETKLVRTARQSSTIPLLFIVGAPRSGTTLLSQVLACYLPVTYFTNLSALFPRAPLTASLLFHRRLRHRQASLHSYYGNTTGLAGINDGFHIWNRWLGRDRYNAPGSLGDATIADMRRFFSAWTETFELPFLNKNNRNTDCVPLLGHALPTAVFVVMRREPQYVVQSLLIAREHIQGDKAYKWSVRSTDQDVAAGPLGYVDSVCAQIVEIERRLRAAQRSLTTDRFIEVQYERFCEDPVAIVEQIAERISLAPIDATAIRRELHLSGRSTNPRGITREELERIQRILEGYGQELDGGWSGG